MKVLCVTPNVSADRTLTVPGFAAGGVWRADRVAVTCGGKGMNVARALSALGHQAVCSGLLGGHTGRLAAEAAGAEGIDAAWTWREGETPTCIAVLGAGGETTVVNEPGALVKPDDWARLETDVAAAAGTAAVCIGGSVPPGVPRNGLARLIAAAAAGRRPVWVDTSGAALVRAAEAGASGIKVNGAEAGSLLGKTVAGPDDALAAADDLCRRGGGAAAVTLGEAGAVLSTRDGGWRVRVPAAPVVSAVGSGDAFLAGLASGLAGNMTPAEALRWAAAAGTANAMTADAGRIDRGDFARILAATTVDVLFERKIP